MDQAEFDSYLKERYYQEIEWYDKRSTSSKTWYQVFQWGLILLSALTPVLIVIEFMEPRYSFIKWLPVVTSVLIAVLASGLQAFKFQENWINYRTTCETLRKEIHFYKASAGQYCQASDKESLFVERVESLISRENTLWLSVVDCEEKKKRETK